VGNPWEVDSLNKEVHRARGRGNFPDRMEEGLPWEVIDR
jgi:hypothetical protein